jgi:hypothetical protein
MPHKPRPAARTLREAEAAGNTLDVDMEQQLLGESAGGDSLPDGMRGGVLFVWVRVVGLFVSFVLIYLSQALIITRVARFLGCSGYIFYLFIVLWDIAHAPFLQLLA